MKILFSSFSCISGRLAYQKITNNCKEHRGTGNHFNSKITTPLKWIKYLNIYFFKDKKPLGIWDHLDIIRKKQITAMRCHFNWTRVFIAKT